MNGWLIITILFLVEAAVVLLAAVFGRDRLAKWLERRLRPRRTPSTPEQHADHLARAYQVVRLLKERTTAGAGLADPTPYDESLDCLRQAAEHFQGQPEAMTQMSEGLLRACTLLTHLLEQQVTAAGALTGALATPVTEPAKEAPRDKNAEPPANADAPEAPQQETTA
jgi:hypothetical protein